MAKELLLYSGIYSFVAEELINAMEENMGSPVTIRVNSGGGDVFATWGIMAKMVEHGDVRIKVDGAAMSSAANLLPYAVNVEALDVSNFVLHRADGYASTPEEEAFLKKVNADLRKQLESKVDAKTFQEVTGATFDQLFNAETRINLFLTAKQMKQLGIVNKITKLSPAEIAAFSEAMKIAAEYKPEIQPIKNSTMTLAELKASNPEIYAQAFAEGVAQEKDRVEACMVFIDVDPVGVKAAVEAGKPLTAKQMAEFSMKIMAKGKLENIVAGNPAPVITGAITTEPEKTQKEKDIAAFESKVQASLKLMSGGGNSNKAVSNGSHHIVAEKEMEVVK